MKYVSTAALSWQLVRISRELTRLLGGIGSVRDYKARFLAEVYEPYRAARARGAATSVAFARKESAGGAVPTGPE